MTGGLAACPPVTTNGVADCGFCEQHWRKDLDEDVVQVLICPQIVLKIGADLLEFRTAINAAIVSGRECGPGHKLGID